MCTALSEEQISNYKEYGFISFSKLQIYSTYYLYSWKAIKYCKTRVVVWSVSLRIYEYINLILISLTNNNKLNTSYVGNSLDYNNF